jgi:hypothetical protein
MSLDHWITLLLVLHDGAGQGRGHLSTPARISL